MFLDTADLRARRRQTLKLAEWDGLADNFLRSNELPLLANAGNVSAERAKQIAEEHYDRFNAKRREGNPPVFSLSDSHNSCCYLRAVFDFVIAPQTA